jgi:hypothetical protein
MVHKVELGNGPFFRTFPKFMLIFLYTSFGVAETIGNFLSKKPLPDAKFLMIKEGICSLP